MVSRKSLDDTIVDMLRPMIRRLARRQSARDGRKGAAPGTSTSAAKTEPTIDARRAFALTGVRGGAYHRASPFCCAAPMRQPVQVLRMLDKHYQPAAIEARIHAAWEDARRLQGRPRRDRAGRQERALLHRHSAAERDRLAAHGPCAQQHAAGHPVPLRAHARQDVLWQPGTDHAGIATQMVVERKLAAEKQPGPARTRPREVPRTRSGRGRPRAAAPSSTS